MYYEALWNAAQTLYRAGDYAAALHYVRTFRQESPDDERTPQALLQEAQCLAALGNSEPAIAICRANIERHPTNINAYRAMLLQADLYRGMGRDGVMEASALYEGILADMRFQAQSGEWRRAIFSLGATLCELGRWREAILRLDEALVRFPEDSEAPAARYALAGAYRAAAFEDDASRKEYLTRAAELFRRVADGGDGLAETLVRSAAFIEADCYYDLGDYTKALVLYSRAVEANVDTPEATRALFQIANCYHRLGSKEQADATYKRALFSLRRGAEAPEPGAAFYEALPRWRAGEEISG
jgi:tetratricopeptide (TPR) repeat protein